MVARQDWVSYQCSCGFRLERVPRTVVAELSRCLGCGKELRATQGLQHGFTPARDLR